MLTKKGTLLNYEYRTGCRISLLHAGSTQFAGARNSGFIFQFTGCSSSLCLAQVTVVRFNTCTSGYESSVS